MSCTPETQYRINAVRCLGWETTIAMRYGWQRIADFFLRRDTAERAS